MSLFGLHEAALVVLIGIVVLLFPRILPRLSRRFGEWRMERQEEDETPVETAVHVYDTVSPVVQASGPQKKAVFLQQMRRFLQKQ